MLEKMTSPSKKESKFPLKEGEVFEPEKELKKISNLHGAEGLKQIAIYKEKLKFQKEGIARIEEEILNFVENNADFSKSDLESLIKKNFSIYALTPEQREKILDVVNELYKKHQALKELIENYKTEEGIIDGRHLFQDLFQKKATGEIKVVYGSYYIYFRFSNGEDFTYVISDAYKKQRQLNDKDFIIAKSMAGAKINSSPLRQIKGTIIIENPVYFENEKMSDSVLKHEKQHIVHNFIDKYHFPDTEQGLKEAENLEKNRALSQEQKLLLLVNNPKIEKRIKDEICAHFKDGTSPKEISKNLLKEDTIYDYGFDYNLTEDYFSPEYLELVENGIVAFANLLKAGYSMEKVINLLYVEPLKKWPKEAERLTGIIKNTIEKERDKNKFISKKIIERDQKLEQKLELKDSYIL